MNRTTANQALTNRIEQETSNFEIAKQTTKAEALGPLQVRISVLTWALDATLKEIENHLNLVKIGFDRDVVNPAVRPISLSLTITELRTLQEAYTIKSHLS